MKGSSILSGYNWDCRCFGVDGPWKPSVVDPQIKQRAIEWLISLDSGDDALQHWPGFQSWLNECPEHRQVYLWVERTWREAGMLITEAGRAGLNGALGPRDRMVRPAPVVIVSVLLVLAVMYYLWSRIWT